MNPHHRGTDGCLQWAPTRNSLGVLLRLRLTRDGNDRSGVEFAHRCRLHTTRLVQEPGRL